ncbi:MAG TPA: HD domain-containing protein, partial [Actinomycetales bacterium]|nr:HD domain-containing protein [Actinomycetales bacterium]
MARLGRLGRPSATGHAALEPLYQAVRATHSRIDLSAVDRAYEVARRAHEGQMRRSGDPYITHPVSVATILAELGMQPAVLIAAL